MEQFRQKSQRSWNVALMVAFSILLGGIQSWQDKSLAQYPPGPGYSPYGTSPSGNTPAGNSPYGNSPYGNASGVVMRPELSPYHAYQVVPIKPAVGQTVQSAAPAVEAPATPAVAASSEPAGPVTSEPPLMGEASPSGESTGVVATENRMETNPAMSPISLGSEPPTDAPLPIITVESPVSANPVPVAVEAATPMPSPEPEAPKASEPDAVRATQVVDQPAATGNEKVTESSSVQPVGLTVTSQPTTDHASANQANTKTDSDKPAALAPAVADAATPAKAADHPGRGESQPSPKQPASVPVASTAPPREQELSTNRPAVADEGNGVGTAVSEASPSSDTWAGIITAKQLLIALLVAMALGTSTGIWALIVLARRQGGSLPDETIELINESLRTWCAHVTSNVEAPAVALRPARVRKRTRRETLKATHVPGVRSAADAKARDDIVQNILKSNRNLMSDSDDESDSKASTPSEPAPAPAATPTPTPAPAAAPGVGVIQVVWEPYSAANRSK